MEKQSKIDHGLFLAIVGLVAWAIPGAGHFAIKERKRAIIIFVTITLTFLIGRPDIYNPRGNAESVMYCQRRVHGVFRQGRANRRGGRCCWVSWDI